MTDTSDILNLQSIIALLDSIVTGTPDGRRESLTITFEASTYMVPVLDFFSYRGMYDHVALCAQQPGSSVKSVNAQDYLNFLKGIPGQEIEGYKGGIYKVDPLLPVYVAQYSGDYSQIGVVGLFETDEGVVIRVGRDDD